jgi:hypothetical protein
MLTPENNTPDNHCEESVLGYDAKKKNTIHVPETKPLPSSPKPINELICPSVLVKEDENIVSYVPGWVLICNFSLRLYSNSFSCRFPVDKEEEKLKLQNLMAYGKIIPPTPVHKKHMVLKAPLNTLKQTDRFAECKYITSAQMCIKTQSYMPVKGIWII